MKSLGFRARLSLGIFLVILLLAMVGAFLLKRQQENAANDALRNKATGVAQILAYLVAASLEFDSKDDAIAQLASAKGDSQLRYAVVVKPGGQAFASYRQDASNTKGEHSRMVEATAITVDDDMVHASVPIRSGENQLIGAVTAGFTRAQVKQLAKDISFRFLWLTCVAAVIGGFLAYLLTRPLVGTALRVSSVSQDLIGAAREQESAAAEESSAVEETRRSMETLLRSAEEIAERSSDVLGNAERSMARSRDIADRISALSVMLESIVKIADRTDLLALNAALEGTRAGEMGKGFGLVAGEMRRLAENVVDLTGRIRKLMEEIHDASQASLEASKDGTVSSEKIALLTQKQKQATEAVTLSMDEMTRVLARNLEGIRRSTTSAEVLADLARLMAGMMDRANQQGAGSGPTPPASSASGSTRNVA